MQISVRKHHTSEIRVAHPYLKKKLSSPPPRVVTDIRHFFFNHFRLENRE